MPYIDFSEFRAESRNMHVHLEANPPVSPRLAGGRSVAGGRWQVEVVMVGDFYWELEGITAGGLQGSFRQGYADVVLKCGINNEGE